MKGDGHKKLPLTMSIFCTDVTNRRWLIHHYNRRMENDSIARCQRLNSTIKIQMQIEICYYRYLIMLEQAQ